MKNMSRALALVLVVLPFAVSGEVNKVKSDKEKQSYAFGYSIGQLILRQFGAELKNMEDAVVGEAVNDVLSGRDLAMTEQEIREVMENWQAEKEKEAAAQAAAKQSGAKEALAAGQAFLKENGAKKGVTTTDSGLQYEVLEAGTGAQPTRADTVTVHYRGTLINGSEFDSSYSRNQPATFGVSGVIPGWTEALQLMKTGAKWKLYIPSELGYGPRGAGASIGPNEVLIFEVELLEIR